MIHRWPEADQAEYLEKKRKRKASKDTSWKRYKDDDPIHWIQTHFIIPETGKPLQLHESQIIPLREALSRDDGSFDPRRPFKYSTVVWGSIKKSAKSTIDAACCLWMMWQGRWRSGKVIANDLKQSQSRVYYYIKRAILLHPEWRETCKISQTKIELPNHSVIEAVAMDPDGEAGGNDDFVSYTEIWAWKSDKAQRMWTESTLSPTKYGKSLRFLDTYAGFSGESIILEKLYDAAVKPELCINQEYEMYAVPEARLFVLWNTRPRLPFQTTEYYQQERASLTASEFSRVHENQWASSEEAFVPVEWWDRCKANIKPIDKRQSMIIILDAAVTGDTFGLMGITAGDIEGEYDIKIARRWIPPPKGRIDFDEVESEVRRLCDEYNVIEVCIDEYQLAQMAERLERDLVANVYRFPQGKQRTIADKRLQDAIRDRKIHHDGNPDLREHVQNANAKAAEDNKLRIVKRADHLKIDLCVCASMGLDRVVSWNL